MYSLRNAQLQVAILDPANDRQLLGTRYCTGGYIFSVVDGARGNLMSGPTYPDSFNTFDGQGIPDAFNLEPLTGLVSPRNRGVSMPRDALALILGVGVCDLDKNEVETWCDWAVEARDTAITLSTRHDFRGYRMALVRAVSLMGRTIRSKTTIKNEGRPLAFRWFPHPFYPHPETSALAKLSIPVTFPESDGYLLGSDGFIHRRGNNWDRGYYQALNHNATSNLVVLQRHPKLGLVGATTSYVPSFFPIWGNANTFSWEPFLERTLAPEQSMTWWIDYVF